MSCPCTMRGDESRVYPRNRPKRVKDERFSTAVVVEVAEALASHGFPPIEEGTPDFYALMWVMTRFVYGDPGQGGCEGTRR